MRRPRWTLLNAMICSAVVIACADDPKEGVSPKVDRATDRAPSTVDVDREVRHEDRTVRGEPRTPGADARDRDGADDIEDAADRAGERLERAGDKAADGLERTGEKIDAAAKKTAEKLRDDDAPREPGADRDR